MQKRNKLTASQSRLLDTIVAHQRTDVGAWCKPSDCKTRDLDALIRGRYVAGIGSNRFILDWG